MAEFEADAQTIKEVAVEVITVREMGEVFFPGSLTPKLVETGDNRQTLLLAPGYASTGAQRFPTHHYSR